MIRLFTAIFILSLNSVYAQDRQLSNDSDTTFWFNWRAQLNQELGIPTIDKSNKEFEFRFWDGYKVVRLWRSNGQLKSDVIYFLREYEENLNRNEGRLYKSGLSLNEHTTNSINNLISDFRIMELPTDSQIEGWSQGMDGIIYITESSGAESFSFKNYWTPTSFSELKEARFFQYFVEQVNSLEQIEKGFDKFMAKQPFRAYYAGIESGAIATLVK